MVTFYPLLLIKNLIKSYPTNPYRINSKIFNHLEKVTRGEAENKIFNPTNPTNATNTTNERNFIE